MDAGKVGAPNRVRQRSKLGACSDGRDVARHEAADLTMVRLLTTPGKLSVSVVISHFGTAHDTLIRQE